MAGAQDGPEDDPETQAEPPVLPQSNYVLLGEFARGARGRILKARDRRLGRLVALKEILDTASGSTARFIRESLITAHLQHPGIVPVYEAGYWPTGAPFYAMKLVSGHTLQEVIQQTKNLRERLALLPNMLAVAEAMAYAHSEGIVHRDLKPANVLVGSFGETVVVDWGLAKSLRRPDKSAERNRGPLPVPVSGDLTIVGSVMGTPAYMAPEQAKGLSGDGRSDVYSLGAMLYHLLCGVAPYQGSGEEVLGAISQGSSPVRLEDREADVPKDLAAIVRKAMALDPADRYPSANEFAVDLKRFQTGQLVSAHEYSTWSLVKRWIGRRRAAVTVAAVLLSALALTALLSFRRIVRERNLAQQERSQAQQARQQAEIRAQELTLMQARSSLDPDPTTTIAWLKTYPITASGWGAVRAIAADAYERGIARRVLYHRNYVNFAIFFPDGKRIASASFDKSVNLWDLDSGKFQVLKGHQDGVMHLDVSSDGKWVASASADNAVRLWNVETGRSQVLTGHEGTVTQVKFSPDGNKLASASFDGTVRIWDRQTGKSRTLKHSGQVWSVKFSPDGNTLVSGSWDKTVRLWNVETGEGRTMGAHSKVVNCVLFSPRGDRILSCGEDGTLQLWDLHEQTHQILRGHSAGIDHAIFSPDGLTIASASQDKTVRLWDLEGHSIKVLTGHSAAVIYLAFSHDGQLLASASTDASVRLWNLVTGSRRVLVGHRSRVAAVQFSPDDNYLVSASWDNTLRLWSLKEREPPLLRMNGAAWHLASAPDGKTLAIGGKDKHVRIWDPSSARVQEFPVHRADVTRLSFSPKGDLLAIAGVEGLVAVWRLPSGPLKFLEGHFGKVNALAFAPDGKKLVSAGEDRTARVWSLDTGASRLLEGHQASVDAVAFFPNGAWIATGGQDHTVRLWDTTKFDGHVIAQTQGFIRQFAFSPDAKMLAVAEDNAHIVDLDSEKMRMLAGGHIITDLSFVGVDQLVAGSRDKRVLLFDLHSGQSRAFRGHESQVTSVSVSPDRKRAASASWDSTVRLWDLETGEPRVLRGHEGNVNWVSFLPDGKHIVSLGDDGTARLWRDDLPTDPHDLRAWMDRVTDATVSGGLQPDEGTAAIAP